MNDTPQDDDPPLPGHLKLLRNLVTLLTLVMIGGVITVIWAFVTRFPAPSSPALPDQITLPDGTTATAFTVGTGWYAVVTGDDTILIFDQDSGELRQTIEIE